MKVSVRLQTNVRKTIKFMILKTVPGIDKGLEHFRVRTTAVFSATDSMGCSKLLSKEFQFV